MLCWKAFCKRCFEGKCFGTLRDSKKHLTQTPDTSLARPSLQEDWQPFNMFEKALAFPQSTCVNLLLWLIVAFRKESLLKREVLLITTVDYSNGSRALHWLSIKLPGTRSASEWFDCCSYGKYNRLKSILMSHGLLTLWIYQKSSKKYP